VSGAAGALDQVLAELVALAESDPAREVCGFVLEGAGGGRPEVVALRNAAHDAGRAFRLDPGDVLAVLRRVDRERCGFVALYHSHPTGGGSLSARDLADLTMEGGPLLPGVELWVIGMSSGKAAEVRAYRWIDFGYAEVGRRRGPFTV
jgi:proteasome lid subunit RPN8/RPN11